MPDLVYKEDKRSVFLVGLENKSEWLMPFTL